MIFFTGKTKDGQVRATIAPWAVMGLILSSLFMIIDSGSTSAYLGKLDINFSDFEYIAVFKVAGYQYGGTLMTIAISVFLIVAQILIDFQIAEQRDKLVRTNRHVTGVQAVLMNWRKRALIDHHPTITGLMYMRIVLLLVDSSTDYLYWATGANSATGYAVAVAIAIFVSNIGSEWGFTFCFYFLRQNRFIWRLSSVINREQEAEAKRRQRELEVTNAEHEAALRLREREVERKLRRQPKRDPRRQTA